MHGYYDGASDREHAVNYLEELGIQKASSPEEAKAIMERDGIATYLWKRLPHKRRR